MDDERFFSYVILKCADEERGEALNIGLVVLDSQSGNTVLRVADDLSRVERTLPNVPLAQLERALNRAHRALPQMLAEGGLPALQRLNEQWQNTLRASNVRSIQAKHIEAVSDKLFARYIAVPGRPAPPPQHAHREVVTSRKVVNMLEVRLKRRGLRENEDFTFDNRLTGLTSSHSRVPVHYPLRVGRLKLFEGLDVNLSNEELTLDFARSVAQKAEQTFRSEEPYEIAVAIRDRYDTDTGRFAEEIVASGGRLDGVEPKVLRYSEPDELNELLNEMQIDQMELPRNGNSN